MVDWNKEVKLSDLIGRKQTEAEEASPATPETETPSFAAPEASSPATPEEPSSTTQATPSPATPVAPSPAEVQLAVDLGTTPASAPAFPPANSPAAPPTDLEQAADLGAAALPELDTEPEERVPWYKREISLGRKSNKPKAEKPAKQSKEKKA